MYIVIILYFFTMATIRNILFQEHTSLPETEEQLVEILVLRL